MDATTEMRPLAGQGLARLFYGAGLAFLIGLIAWVGRGVLVPVVIAGFLAILITALKNAIVSAPAVGRYMPAWLAYILAFGVIAAGLVGFVAIVADNAGALVDGWPRYLDRLDGLYLDVAARYEAVTGLRLDALRGDDGEFISLKAFVRDVGKWLPELTGPLLGVLESARRLIASLAPILLYTAFMLIEGGTTLRKASLAASSDADREAVGQVISEIGEMVREYVSIKTLTSALTAGAGYIVMRFFDVDFAGFWALLLFALNYIPIIGSIVATAFPVVLALIEPDGGLLKSAGVAVFLTAVQQAVGSVIEPRMLGRSLNLSPLVILLSLSIWGALWGVAGALLCVPIMVALMIVLSRFQTTRAVAILMSATGEIASKRVRSNAEAA